MTDIVNLTAHYIGAPAVGVNLYEIPNASMQVIGDVINASWGLAQTKAATVDGKFAAISGTGGALDGTAPHVTAPTAISAPSVTPPTVTFPTTISTANILTDFDTEYAAIQANLAAKFAAFRTSYFPEDQTDFEAARTWISSALANPNSGLPTAVQAQIWGDDAARILGDKSRAQDAVIAQFAARGFPLPPGAAASAVMQIEQKAQDEMAESSRKVAILSVEMQKFNIQQMLGLRDLAMKEALQYITVMASATDSAGRVVGIGYDAQTKLISAVSQYYGMQIQAAELAAKVGEFNNTITMTTAEKNQAADISLREDKVKVLVAEATTLAHTAAALFNNLHASVGLSSNGGTTVSSSGSF